jgi:hypothetical protein
MTIGLCGSNEIIPFRQKLNIETVEHLIMQDIARMKLVLTEIGVQPDGLAMLAEGILAFIHFYSEHDIEKILESDTSGKVSVYSNNFDVKSYNNISHRKNVLSFRSQQTTKVSGSNSGNRPVVNVNIPRDFDHLSPIANSNFNFETQKEKESWMNASDSLKLDYFDLQLLRL